MTDAPITIAPGIYDAMSAGDYHAIDAISATTLKQLEATSPAHVRYGIHERTDAMLAGSAFHCAILEPELFEERYYQRPVGDGRTKAVQESIRRAEQDNEGKEAILARDWLTLRKIGAVVQCHPLVAPLLFDSKKEVSLVWEDDFDGPVLCKARLDILKPTGIADLKSTKCAEPRAFSKEILFTPRCYWLQAAFYARGAWALGLTVQDFTFVAVELDEPFALSVHVIEEAELRGAQDRVAALAGRWAECLRTQKFPGYPMTRNIINLGGDDE